MNDPDAPILSRFSGLDFAHQNLQPRPRSSLGVSHRGPGRTEAWSFPGHASLFGEGKASFQMMAFLPDDSIAAMCPNDLLRTGCAFPGMC
jgi:hypothetical protein